MVLPVFQFIPNLGHIFTGSPLVCGGRRNGDYTDVCSKYDAALDEWITLPGAMTERRGWSGYTSGYYRVEDWGLVMAGGTNGDGFLSSVERTINGEVFRSLPDLPNENQESCLVILDEYRLFTCGGYPTGSDALIFSPSTGSWNR